MTTTTTRRLLLCTALAGVITACDGAPPRALAASAADGGAAAVAEGSFVPDPRPSGPSVRVQRVDGSAGELRLELVIDGVEDVYGVAFRLEHDPQRLSFGRVESSWPLTGARETRPGLLVAYLSERGVVVTPQARGPAQIVFKTGSAGESPLAFVARESVVVNVGGEAVPAQFVGGTWVLPDSANTEP